jgi:lysophospholipase L1-like esterase/pimeloyl-ACP methyl ester carboxylesterase
MRNHNVYPLHFARLLSFFLIALGAVSALCDSNPSGVRTRVACVGASITFGAGLSERESNCYPARLQAILGNDWDVRNFGVNGRTMLKNGDYPYWDNQAFKDACNFNPDVVVIDLGGNDSKSQNWRFKAEFASDARAMISAFRALPAHPRVIVCVPMPAFKVMWGIDDEVITRQLTPMLRQVAYEEGVELVDLHTAFIDKEAWFPDNIHPNKEGAALMARVIGSVISFKAEAPLNFERALFQKGIPSRTTSFYGFRQVDFELANKTHCTVVCPARTAAGHPIAWRGEYFGHEPQTDLGLLQLGFHVVYVDVPNLFGGPQAMESWEKCRETIVSCGLDGRMVLIGMSIGGLYSYNWALRHPETVSVIYGDAPVCNLRGWPGKPEQHRATRANWDTFMRVYGFTNEAQVLNYRLNPLDNLEVLSKAGIAIIHVVGQEDDVVFVGEHTDLVEKRYHELGGVMEVIRKPGCGHHPHSLPNPAPIVDFIVTHFR